MAKKKNNNNNSSNVVEQKEGGENKKGGDGGGKKQENNPNSVVLKVEMHCEGCVSTILKHARAFEGVESVEAEATSNKLTVMGKVDPLKIRDYLHYKTKKKVELISPQPQKQDTTTANKNNKEDKKSNDKKADSDAKPKEAPVITAVLKLGLHCQGCIEKIDKIVTKTKGVHEIVIDKQKELVTVKGTMDVKALTETLKSRLKRPVDIVPPKKEKEGGKDGENVAGGGGGKKKKVAEETVGKMLLLLLRLLLQKWKRIGWSTWCNLGLGLDMGTWVSQSMEMGMWFSQFMEMGMWVTLFMLHMDRAMGMDTGMDRFRVTRIICGSTMRTRMPAL